MSRRPPRGGAADGPPIEIDVIEDNAYVWTVPAVRRLRERHRLVGAMAGGLAGFKSQVAVRGLPLRLSKEEATLALSRGWAVLAPAPPAVARLRVVAGDPAAVAGGGGGGGAGAGAGRAAGSKRAREPEAHACAGGGGDGDEDDDEGAYADYYAEYYGGTAGVATAAAPPQEDEEEEGDDDDDDDEDDGAARPWTAAVTEGTHMNLPTTAAEAEAVNARAGGRRRRGEAAGAAEGAAAPAPMPTPSWPYPSTPYERLRAAVFADLHDQGFTLTDGSKFGGDYLAYPGDPFVYHAQFVVRVLPPSTMAAAAATKGGAGAEGGAGGGAGEAEAAAAGAVRATMLKAWARGVHGARKHLLLVTCDAGAAGAGGAAPRLRYLTIAKESGFVSSAAPAAAAAAGGDAPPRAAAAGRGGGRGTGGGRRGKRGGRR